MIAGYNKWRSWCGLSVGNSFSSLPDIVDQQAKAILREVYE